MSYGEYLRTLDPTDPRQLAIVHSAGMLFRGAGYTPFDGTVPGGRHPVGHRRCLRPLHRPAAPADRPVCPGDLRGAEQRHGCPGLGPRGTARPCRRSWRPRTSWPPGWSASPWTPWRRRSWSTTSARSSTPSSFPGRSRRNGKNGNGTARTGTASNGNGNGNGPSGIVQIAEPAVTARCPGELESGTQVRVRIVSSDIATREVRLELVG